MTYIQVQVRIDCQECGYPIPLNGPWLSCHCDNCQADSELPGSFWIDILNELVSDLHEMKSKPERMTVFDEYGTNVLFCKSQPRCPRCKTKYPEKEAPGEASFECGSCGRPATMMPAPDWLRKGVRNVAVLYNATAQGAPPDSAARIKPVTFSCIQCGAALKVDGSARILTCSYCDADNYIPDPLWLRLHPATIMAKWFIGFEKGRGK